METLACEPFHTIFFFASSNNGRELQTCNQNLSKVHFARAKLVCSPPTSHVGTLVSSRVQSQVRPGPKGTPGRCGQFIVRYSNPCIQRESNEHHVHPPITREIAHSVPNFNYLTQMTMATKNIITIITYYSGR